MNEDVCGAALARADGGADDGVGGEGGLEDVAFEPAVEDLLRRADHKLVEVVQDLPVAVPHGGEL